MITIEQFTDMLRRRRSVRRFAETPVDRAGLGRLLEAARVGAAAPKRPPVRLRVGPGGARAHIDRLANKYLGKQTYDGPADEQRLIFFIRPGAAPGLE